MLVHSAWALLYSNKGNFECTKLLLQSYGPFRVHGFPSIGSYKDHVLLRPIPGFDSGKTRLKSIVVVIFVVVPIALVVVCTAKPFSITCRQLRFLPLSLFHTHKHKKS